jgi:hypothetical protein
MLIWNRRRRDELEAVLKSNSRSPGGMTTRKTTATAKSTAIATATATAKAKAKAKAER